MKKVSEFKSERELQEDLSEFLRSSGLLTFTEIEIPHEGARADIIALTPHRYSTKDVRIYEVKLTRSAWLSDKKYQKYLNCCNRLYIACPKGLIKKEELPNEVGLITRSDNGWRVAKSPRLNINPSRMDVDFILSLLYRGYEESKVMRRLKDRIAAEENLPLSKKAYSIGNEIARRLDRTKESQIEKWSMELWELFNKFGFEVPEQVITCDRFSSEHIHLPSIYEIENLLSGSEALMKDLAAIKAIGRYLENIQYPEESEKDTAWYSRKNNRTKALELIR